jgi:UDP-glucose 4-epimerase
MKKILLVGANSYIANMFIKYIDKEEQNILIDKVSASDGKWRDMDLCQYDVIVMLAAIVHVKEKKILEECYMQVNYELPIEVAIKAKQSKVRHFVFFSTAAVYGSKVTRITAQTAIKPDTIYGYSKMQAEKRLVELQTEEYKITILRPPMVYGEGCKGNYSRLIKLAKINGVYPLIHNKRSIVHIETLCKFLYEVIEYEKEGIFFPQDNEYADTIMIIKGLRDDMGKKTLFIPGVAWLVKIFMRYSKTIRKMFGNWYFE